MAGLFQGFAAGIGRERGWIDRYGRRFALRRSREVDKVVRWRQDAVLPTA